MVMVSDAVVFADIVAGAAVGGESCGRKKFLTSLMKSQGLGEIVATLLMVGLEPGTSYAWVTTS